jgi:hypothetical protein
MAELLRRCATGQMPDRCTSTRLDSPSTPAKTRVGPLQLHLKTISVSPPRLEIWDDEIHQVLLHEVAHAMASTRAPHGARWKAIAADLGCGKRLHDGAIANRALAPGCRTCQYLHHQYHVAYALRVRKITTAIRAQATIATDGKTIQRQRQVLPPLRWVARQELGSKLPPGGRDVLPVAEHHPSFPHDPQRFMVDVGVRRPPSPGHRCGVVGPVLRSPGETYLRDVLSSGGLRPRRIRRG